jgi:hypothetical protein
MIIEAKPALADLPAILGDHSIEDYRKILDVRRKKLNDELKALPVRIDEAHRSMPKDLGTVDALKLETDRSLLRQLQERRATAAAGGEIAGKTLELRRIESELLDIANRARAGAGDDRQQSQALARAKDSEIRDAESLLANLRSRKRLAETELASLENRLNDKRAEFRKINEQVFEPGSGVCFACKQPLPADQKEHAEAEFNEAKAKALERNNEEGRSVKKLADAQRDLVAKATEEITSQEALVARLQEERSSIVIPEAREVDLAADPEYAAKLGEKADLEGAIDLLRTGASTELQDIDRATAEVQARISEAEQLAAKQTQKEQLQQRIEDLKRQQKDYATDLEAADREIFLMEEFTRAKVSMLTERINARFSLVSFKLFDQTIGTNALIECCEATIGGRAYADLSTSEKINAGLDIINTLADHHGFAPPIFIDNCESITHPLPTKGQQIRLKVSESDQTLRIEIESPRAQEALIA